MLSEHRVKEAGSCVKSYFDEGLLKKAPPKEEILNVLMRNAKESLTVAQQVRNSETSDLWIIVCSYYSMYYYANAALLKLGYKVGDKIVHKVTADALIVFVRNRLESSLISEYEEAKDEAMKLAGLRAESIIESFDYERSKRNSIQYRTIETEKHSKAETSLRRAKEFAKEMKRIIM